MRPPMNRTQDPLVSVVVPVLDEEDCVAELARRVDAALAPLARYELIFVDDGSEDGTPGILADLHRKDSSVKAIRLTRSFGHQAALIAGLIHARGDCVITMDGDLQHPPEVLPDLIEQWRHGFDVVSTLRRGAQEGRFGAKDRLGRSFYRLMRGLTRVPMVPAGGSNDDIILSRKDLP